ncbi:unnamed protein product [Allacma fusca]|uniref:Uncharacterized protein n=1 Tax=Allacma fusca TaxID=39272 RepID=A0A8J2NIG3_9HEXA|nr:unnamed protein product [Allacma fusca]
MGGIFRVAVFLGVLWSFGAEPFKFLASAAADFPIYFDPSLENSDGGDYWQGMTYTKRAGFWSPHPSDYNPMRRPNPVLRPSSKRDFDQLPYHPLAKGVSLIQRFGGGPDDYVDALLDGSDLRLKKHIWPSNLVYRLGTGPNATPNLPNRKQKYVPSEPGNKK